MYLERVTNILVIMALLSTNSCKEKTYLLADSDLKWLTYNEGDVSRFISSNGLIDSIKITSISRNTNPEDPLDINPEIIESLTVVASTFNQEGLIKNSFPLITISATENEHCLLHFSLRTELSWFYGHGYAFSDTLKKEKNKFFSEMMYTIQSDSDSFKERKNFIKNIYWDDKKGLVGYDNLDGVIWKRE